MYKVEEQKVRRKMWIKSSNIPKARLGWELDDCVDTDPEDIEQIRGWISLLDQGVNVRASGSKHCGKGLMIAGKPGRGKSTVAVATIQDIMRLSPPSAFDVEDGLTLVRPCYFMTFNDVLALSG